MKNRSVVYQGYYGAKNSGDDAFVEVASWGAHKYWNANKHLFFAQELPRTTVSVNHFWPYTNIFSFTRSITEVFKSDIYVSAGGSTFHSALKKTDLRTYAKLKTYLPTNANIGAIGISLGPYTSIQAEKNTVEYLKRLDFLALRDSRSFELATSYNLPYKPVEAFDLAALLPVMYLDNTSTNQSAKKIVGVSVCNYEQYIKNGDLKKQTLRNEYLKNLLVKLSKDDNILFRFFIFNGHSVTGDLDLTNSFIETLKNAGARNIEVVPYLADVVKTWDKIRECSIMVSTRLHASIFACFADIPFFLAEYHQKCTDFLTDVGQSDQYRLYDGQRNLDEIINEIQVILYDKKYTDPSNKKLCINKSLRNFTETVK